MERQVVRIGEVRVAGPGAILPESGRALGPRTVECARATLSAPGIPIHAEAVGGVHGRSVYLHTANGRVVVSSARFPDVEL